MSKKIMNKILASIIAIGCITIPHYETSAATVGFNTVTFESSTTKNWTVVGSKSAHNLVSHAGSQALKVTMVERSKDWGDITKLNITPPNDGDVWNIGKGGSISATVTNPESVAIQVRINTLDADKNMMMCYYNIPANSTKELVVTSKHLGTPGVKLESWSGDGYSGKGVDTSKLTEISFYFSEPQDTIVMPGITTASYIIDNIKINPGTGASSTTSLTPAPAPISSSSSYSSSGGGSSFSKISFESGEALNWKVGGSNSHYEITDSQTSDGSKSLNVIMEREASKQSDATSLILTPPSGGFWNIAKTDALIATVTNMQEIAGLTLRAELTDKNNNVRTAYFSLMPGIQRTIVIGTEHFGSPGVTSASWSVDGYYGKGIDSTAIKQIKFYIPEADPQYMEFLDLPVNYIIDNIHVARGAGHQTTLAEPKLPRVSTSSTSSYTPSATVSQPTITKPTTVSQPTTTVAQQGPTNFTKISFEDGEQSKWGGGGKDAKRTVVTGNGVVDGSKALRVDMNSRSSDWGNLTNLAITPFDGTPWNLKTSNTIHATITNLNAFDWPMRINVTDTKGNSRLTFFTIPANSKREIEITGEYFGEPGVTNAKWAADGYAQKGIDTSCIKELRFYIPEPDAALLPGVTKGSYIIDNIYVD
ncbi:MAG: hypothetical protein ATN31_00595 [Candidatus Epulonipiscioides saccharophilum]|nr:MAG: hypothetical protein ATN31_00595 [Epulopiscium sp. AS2M-Bin001]